MWSSEWSHCRTEVSAFHIGTRSNPRYFTSIPAPASTWETQNILLAPSWLWPGPVSNTAIICRVKQRTEICFFSFSHSLFLNLPCNSAFPINKSSTRKLFCVCKHIGLFFFKLQSVNSSPQKYFKSYFILIHKHKAGTASHKLRIVLL